MNPIFNSALGLVIVAALLLNIFMLYILRGKAIRRDGSTVKNVVFINLAFANIIQVAFGFSIQLINSMTRRPNINFCMVSGFVIAFCGYASITFLAIVSFDVCLHVCRPLKSIVYKYRMSPAFVAFGWLYGLIWSTAPFFGLGGYVAFASNTCSLKWVQNTLNGKLFLLSIFFFCYALPVTIIVTCFGCIHVNMKRKSHQSSSFQSTSSRNSARLIRRASIGNLRLSFFITTAFMLSWTPYAIAAGYIFLSGRNTVPKELLLTSAFAAKCWSLWNPLLYFYFDKTARPCLCQLFWKCKCQFLGSKEENSRDILRSSFTQN